jgi:hypothetical protein
MQRWGFSVAVMRDAVDVLYSPTAPPYTSREEARAIQAAYFERFLAPTACFADGASG